MDLFNSLLEGFINMDIYDSLVIPAPTNDVTHVSIQWHLSDAEFDRYCGLLGATPEKIHTLISESQESGTAVVFRTYHCRIQGFSVTLFGRDRGRSGSSATVAIGQ